MDLWCFNTVLLGALVERAVRGRAGSWSRFVAPTCGAAAEPGTPGEAGGPVHATTRPRPPRVGAAERASGDSVNRTHVRGAAEIEIPDRCAPESGPRARHGPEAPDACTRSPDTRGARLPRSSLIRSLITPAPVTHVAPNPNAYPMPNP